MGPMTRGTNDTWDYRCAPVSFDVIEMSIDYRINHIFV